jgi:putative transposase
MSQYRRANTPGATYFFTLITYRRQTILCDTPIREALREAIIAVRNTRPFVVDAWVLLPDHLHCIWTLPVDDADFSQRWASIKRKVSIKCGESYKRLDWVTQSKRKHRESTIWQRRFWEHQIRDDKDFQRHVDYIHWNPVKHGHVTQVSDWPYSTFHRYVKQNIYSHNWGGVKDDVDASKFGE